MMVAIVALSRQAQAAIVRFLNEDCCLNFLIPRFQV